MRIVALLATVAMAYAGGVVTGVLGSSAPAPRSGVTTPDVLDQAAAKIFADSVTPVTRAELQRAAVEGMLQALGDRWSSYYAPTEYTAFQAVLDGRYTGVGLWVRLDDDQVVRVVSVQASSPADHAQIKVGDELVTIGGRPVAGRTIADVVSDLRGDTNTDVEVTVRRDHATRSITLTRTAMNSGDVSWRKVGSSVMLIKVNAFTRGVGKQVHALVDQARAQHMSGIVLDLRDNPGGLLDEAVETTSSFVDGGVVVSFVRRGEAPVPLVASGRGNATVPLAVLVDGGTASAAEVVAGALQDRNRAVIIGSQTFGKGSVQEPAQLADGSALELTIGHYLTPSGRKLDGVGIEPDVEIPAGASSQAMENRAVDVLSGVLADRGTSGRG